MCVSKIAVIVQMKAMDGNTFQWYLMHAILGCLDLKEASEIGKESTPLIL